MGEKRGNENDPVALIQAQFAVSLAQTNKLVSSWLDKEHSGNDNETQDSSLSPSFDPVSLPPNTGLGASTTAKKSNKSSAQSIVERKFTQLRRNGKIDLSNTSKYTSNSNEHDEVQGKRQQQQQERKGSPPPRSGAINKRRKLGSRLSKSQLLALPTSKKTKKSR